MSQKLFPFVKMAKRDGGVHNYVPQTTPFFFLFLATIIVLSCNKNTANFQMVLFCLLIVSDTVHVSCLLQFSPGRCVTV